MPLSVRVYLFEEGGEIKRVPRRVLDNLTFGLDAIPEYAGTRQRVAEFIIENENGKAIRILDMTGYYWGFDEKGRIHKDLREAGAEALMFAWEWS